MNLILTFGLAAILLLYVNVAAAYKANVDTRFTDSCWSKLVVKLSSGGHIIKKKTLTSDPTDDDSNPDVITSLKFKSSDVVKNKIKVSVNLDDGFNSASSSKTFNTKQSQYDFIYFLETDEQTCFQ